jgi:hypothetical protein
MTRKPASTLMTRRRALALGAAALAWPAPFGALAGTNGKGRPTRLSADRYYTFDPFTIPLMHDGIVKEQFVMVIAVELGEDGSRADIAELVPKFRDAMYKELYRMVTFRRNGTPIPSIDMFKARLYIIARRIAGDEIVAALLVQQAYKRRAR